MNQLQKTTYSALNLAAGALLATCTLAGDSESRRVVVRVLLKSAYGRGATYTFILKRTDEDGNTFPLPHQTTVIGAADTHLGVELPTITLNPGETLQLFAASSSSYDANCAGTVWFTDASTAQLSAAGLAGLMSQNVDSTGEGLSLQKAIEAMLAVLAGNAQFNGDSGEETFLGRDGATPIVSIALTGSGTRTQSEIL